MRAEQIRNGGGVVRTDCVEVKPKTPVGLGYTSLDWSE